MQLVKEGSLHESHDERRLSCGNRNHFFAAQTMSLGSVPATTGGKTGDLVAEVETSVDYAETAQLANDAFAEHGAFSAEHLRWLYERSFSEGSTVVSLRANGRKVGQFAMVRQKVVTGGVVEPAVQLVDLFVLKSFRSRQALSCLYGEVEAQCMAQGIRFAIGMPNASAIAVNDHYLRLKPHLWLDIRAGIAFPGLVAPSVVINEPFSAERLDLYRKWLSFYETPLEENAVPWTAEALCDRLSNPKFRYGLHAVENLLLVSSPRVRRGTPYTLHCGYFIRRGAQVRRRDIVAVTRAASRLWRHPLFVYPGLHTAMPQLPGLQLPRRLRPSTMLVQLRDFQPHKPPLRFDRYQPLDFDFA